MKRDRLWEKDFTLVVIGQIISLFGNGILRFALPLYLLSITGSPATFGIVSAVSFLPIILLMPIGGMLADRVNKRNIMVTLDFLTGFLMLFFYLTMDTISVIPLLVSTMMILYSISSIYQPTVQASIPILLDEKILVKGNGIVSSIAGLANLISPMIGGVLFGSFGIVPIILVSIVCFFISAILEIFIKIPYKKQPNAESIFSMMKEDTRVSVNFIFKEKPTLRKLMFITCILNGFISALIIISLPVLITQRLEFSKEMYGIAQGVLALGGICGGIMTGVFGEKLNIRNLYKYIILIAISLLPIALAMDLNSNDMITYVLILISEFLAMCFATFASIIIITFIQSETEENMVGKIMAFVMTASMFASPIGQVIYGMAFEYLIGYEFIIFLAVILVSFIISLYSKRILEY